MIPCLIHEDEHLLVVNKPAGLNTHSPSPYAGEGIYEWLKHREPRWANLAILHRLDKDTSGVLVFGKTKTANQSLTRQFSDRTVGKKYLLLTDRPLKQASLVVQSRISRMGRRYQSGSKGESAETRFTRLSEADAGRLHSIIDFGFRGANEETETVCPGSLAAVIAEPLTGRTHQIRVHAAESGFPVLGDTLYGGTSHARLCLHATEISIGHPETNKEVTFSAPVNFSEVSRFTLRRAFIDPDETDAWRLIHGAADGRPGWYVDKLGRFLLSQSEHRPNDHQVEELSRLMRRHKSAGACHKNLNRQVRRTTPDVASPEHLEGDRAPRRFEIRENGVRFELSFDEGYSVGLFPDQRDNRRRLLTGHVAAGFPLIETAGAGQPGMLNTFAYTCGFSVCAAKAGFQTTSLDLSKKYLAWGQRNFELNGLDSSEHDFIFGDAFEWFKRLAKKGRRFNVVLLDPPTFSRSKTHGVFRAEKNYGELVRAALPLLKEGGVLFASTNAANFKPADFLSTIQSAIAAGGRAITQRHYVPQPPDFPITRAEPSYLRTSWFRVV